MNIDEYFLIETKFYDVKQSDNIIIFKTKSNLDLDLNNSTLSFKCLKNGNIKILVGFSMNLKMMNITYKEEVFQINNTHCLEILSEIDNELNFKPQYSQISSFEIYMKIENFSNLCNNLIEGQKNFISIKLNSKKPIRKIVILLTEIIKSIGDYFKMIFEKKGIECNLIYRLKLSECFDFFNNNDSILLILFFNESHMLLPNRVIYYQIEQKNSIFWTDDKKLKRTLYIMEKSEKVWDFMKIARFIYEKNCNEKLLTVYMPFIKYKLEPQYLKNFDECTYDIFFYGNPNLRRIDILNKLSKYFNVKIGFECYGNEKLQLIADSKIILNLHYYKDAGLETCRINEILNFKKIIISEKSNFDKDNMILYKDLIVYVDEIDDKLENIERLIKHIRYYLKKSNYLKFIESIDENLDVLENKIGQMIKL